MASWLEVHARGRARLKRRPPSERPHLIRSRVALAFLVFAVLAILSLTLAPGEPYSTPGPFDCIVCGERGLADIILNIILFVPAGMLAARAFGARPAVVIGAAFLSGLIEIAQVVVPGRDSAVGDVIFNTAGGLVGLLLVATADAWLRPGARLRRIAAVVCGLLVPGLVAMTGWLARPTFSDAAWFSMQNPDLSHLVQYTGEVLSGRVGPVTLPASGWLPAATRDSVHASLVAGDEIHVRVVAGEPPPGTVALLAIYDAGQREVLLLGPRFDDLLVRIRHVSDEVRIDRLDVRVRDALEGVTPGDTLDLRATRNEGEYCLSIGGWTTCGLGMNATLGWSMLYGPGNLKAWSAAVVALGWAATLAALLGFYARDRFGTVVGVLGWLAAFIGVPAVDPYILATPPAGIAAAAFGFLAAAVIGVRIERSRAPRHDA